MLRSTAAAAVLLATFAGSSALAKPACVTPAEAKALQFRQLQIELMVAALRCRAADPSIRDNYASYVSKAGPALKRNAGELRTMFARYGQGGAQMDRLITELSNEASMRSLYAVNYCQTQAERLAHVLNMPAQDLHSYAAESVDVSAPLCTSPAKREVKGPSPVAKAAPSGG